MCMKKTLSHLSGWLALAFLPAALLVGGLAAFSATGQQMRPTFKQLINGEARAKFEKALDENIWHHEASINGWGLFEYLVFHEGRDGVVPGRNGWLFTSEEFALNRGEAANYATNMTYFRTVAETLKANGAALAIVLIPAKARIHESALDPLTFPTYKGEIYARTLAGLRGEGIPAPDLLAAFTAAPQAPFLKTDTHWSPVGAELAARTLADTLKGASLEILWPRATVALTQTPGADPHRGDLLRYVRLGSRSDALIPPDPALPAIKGSVATDGGADALFGDAAAPVITLVGTSYSANPKWGFEAFLKDALQADILNAADEGQGPFTTMKAYLSGKTFKNTPPKLVIWEIPERYLTFSYDLSTGSNDSAPLGE